MIRPNIGDRVTLEGDATLYVVVAVDPETETCSLLPESELEQAELSRLVPVRDSEQGDGSAV